MDSQLESSLIASRGTILKKVQEVFKPKAVEGHLFGSMARGNSDALSDIDIWFTFPDENIKEVLAHRFEDYSKVGEILHVCEPSQNAPVGGVQTSVVYKNEVGYTTVDCSLCPLSTASKLPEAKRLFGKELPIKNMEYNPQKVSVNETYRIDFLISMVLATIKKVKRNKPEPLSDLLKEYQYLYERYGISIEPVKDIGHDFATLKKIIENIWRISNDKQRKMLRVASDFINGLQVD